MIGIAGPSADVDRLVDAIEGVEVATGSADEVVAAGPDLVVAVGSPTASAVVRAGVAAPVLTVDGGDGLDSIPEERVPAELARVVRASFETRSRPVIEVSVDGEVSARGLFDAMLVTGEPARISEYAVETPGGADQFRADGVVIATPAGSHGYTRALGGPVLDPDAACLLVLPVAAFAIQPTTRVTGTDASVSVSVVRDEGEISLLVDGERRGRVPPKRPVRIEVPTTVETIVPASE